MSFNDMRMQKAIKTHKCDFCGGDIFTAEIYRVCVGAYEGVFYSMKQCPSCVKLFDWYGDKSGESVYSYDDIIDYINDEICVSCSNRNECDIDTSKCPCVYEIINNEV